eukprot:1157909-Pelagomonas_calceolata.AAC.13
MMLLKRCDCGDLKRPRKGVKAQRAAATGHGSFLKLTPSKESVRDSASQVCGGRHEKAVCNLTRDADFELSSIKAHRRLALLTTGQQSMELGCKPFRSLSFLSIVAPHPSPGWSVTLVLTIGNALQKSDPCFPLWHLTWVVVALVLGRRLVVGPQVLWWPQQPWQEC